MRAASQPARGCRGNPDRGVSGGAVSCSGGRAARGLNGEGAPI